ncbi:MAG TPA: helix-turn-helix domain-containing protein [Candidatus Limnocylindrales bacterium]|nr:helix-turn-helix domain-containing protein [Candidatus Limnocylindrales bacterium]
MSDLYTVERVATLLGLHIKTVRGYVRDGKLKATRLGKSYRIARADLEAFAGGPVEAPPAGRQRRVDVSTVVQIDALSPELASRITTTITAAASGAPADAERLHIQAIYNAERASMKVILAGGADPVAETLKIIDALVGS